MNEVVKMPIRFGVYDKLPTLLANSLGSYETTLMRMVTGYSEFANGGKKISASLVDRIQDRNGKTIWRHDERKCEGCNTAEWKADQSEPLLPDTRAQAIDARTAYQIVSMLEGVVQRGTGVSVQAVGKPLAGKTGTSNEARSLWFIGFSPDLVAGVFMGFDNNRSMGRSEQAAYNTAPVFRDFMKEALKDAPPTPFRVAPGIELVSIDHMSGLPSTGPGSILEAFKAGTAPGEYVGPEPSDAGVPQAPGAASAGNNGQQPQTPPASVGEGTGGLY
jgi:penicillin-binding protein 1A